MEKERWKIFDAWIRVHLNLGGEIVGICEKSMHITGTVKQWEEWSGLEFPKSGKNIVPNALVPVDIDIENDLGTYIEPNVWIIHRTN